MLFIPLNSKPYVQCAPTKHNVQINMVKSSYVRQTKLTMPVCSTLHNSLLFLQGFKATCQVVKVDIVAITARGNAVSGHRGKFRHATVIRS